MMNINRRQFLTLAATGTGMTLATHKKVNQQQLQPLLAQSSPTIAPVYRSQNGLLELDLEALYTKVNLGDRFAYLLTYNGQIPAPRLEAKAGDTIRIHFKNSLAQPTNLHYHGLHIPPTGKADNIFLTINPQESFTYEFKIPQDHQAGIFWYHPHLHGYVADQLAAGLAGLFVIRGALDEIPEIKAAKEEFLVLQDFALDDQDQLLSSNYLNIMAGREGKIVTVNGKMTSSFSLAQNGLLRLRILNASVSRFYNLSLENHPFYLIGTDGGAIAKPIEMSELLLTPGQRAEILIQGNQPPKSYRLLSLPYHRGGMGMMGGMMSNNQTSNTPIVLATLNYDSPVKIAPLPTQLIPISSLPNPQKIRRFTLNHGMSQGRGMAFLINGQPYEHQVINTKVKLNTVEDWEIVNTGVMDHPFHLHVNHFQVISRNGQPEPFLAWRDTILVRQGETVRIRIPFQNFTGKTVYHCHILDHEDLGMMGNIEIS